MLPFKALLINGERIIRYTGNNLFTQCDLEANKTIVNPTVLESVLNSKKYSNHLLNITSSIFHEVVNFFLENNSCWCNLPLTTQMISSPGQVYRGEKINYTTDSLPIMLDWFGNNERIFLSESSQFYLEFVLAKTDVESVYSVYNSFRKEKSTFCKVPEFQHVEYEGKIMFEENKLIATNLCKYLIKKLISKNLNDLLFFISYYDIEYLKSLDEIKFKSLSFSEAMDLLYNEISDDAYLDISLKHFGDWEEIYLSSLFKYPIWIESFPLLEIPFYHKAANDNRYSKSADLILPGYREVIGSGERICSLDEIKYKADIFNLPKDHYNQYIKIRDELNYHQTSGFGLGIQRFVQWILKLPDIKLSTQFPRDEFLPQI